MAYSKEKAEKLAGYINRMMDIVIKSECACLNDASAELSMQELRTIKFIGDKEQCIMREISDHLMLAVSTLTAIIDKLVNKKFVIRYRPDEDRRIVKVQLTDKGRDIYNIDKEHHTHLSEGMLRYLNDDEQDMIINLLSKINSNIINGFPQKV